MRTESQKWRSHIGLSAGMGKERKVTGHKKHNWQGQNGQEEVKNSIGNGKAKELICTTHGHELSRGMLERMEVPGGWDKGEKK